MALTSRRHLFGRVSGDWSASIDSNGFLKSEPNATLWVWLVESGGSRVTDLESVGGSAIDELVTNSTGTIPKFYGPVDVRNVWVGSPSGGERTLLLATDLHEDIDVLDVAIESVEVTAGVQTINDIEPVDGDLELSPSDLEPAAATASGLSSVSAIVGARVLQTSGAYPPRPSAAQYAMFVGTVDPGGNANDGDIWLQPETS